jgi:hypothetical protein
MLLGLIVAAEQQLDACEHPQPVGHPIRSRAAVTSDDLGQEPEVLGTEWLIGSQERSSRSDRLGTGARIDPPYAQTRTRPG